MILAQPSVDKTPPAAPQLPAVAAAAPSPAATTATAAAAAATDLGLPLSQPTDAAATNCHREPTRTLDMLVDREAVDPQPQHVTCHPHTQPPLPTPPSSALSAPGTGTR